MAVLLMTNCRTPFHDRAQAAVVPSWSWIGPIPDVVRMLQYAVIRDAFLQCRRGSASHP